MNIREKLFHGLHTQTFDITLFGYTISISDSILVMWFIMFILIVFAYFAGKKLSEVPRTKLQVFLEIFIGGIHSFIKDIVGHHWKKFAPFLTTMFIFLVFSNIVSIFAIFPSGEQLYKITGLHFFEKLPLVTLKPPTKNLNVNFALAVCMIGYSISAGISTKGIKGWLRGLMMPSPIVAPMNIIEYGIRAFSLSIRLFGNILCAFTIMEAVYLLVPIILPAGLSIYFDLFDGILQAFIFCFLSSIYIYEVVE